MHGIEHLQICGLWTNLRAIWVSGQLCKDSFLAIVTNQGIETVHRGENGAPFLGQKRLDEAIEVHLGGDGASRPDLEVLAREIGAPVTFHGQHWVNLAIGLAIGDVIAVGLRISGLAVGDVVAIGFPLGLGGSPTVTRGIVSSEDRTIDLAARLQRSELTP